MAGRFIGMRIGGRGRDGVGACSLGPAMLWQNRPRVVGNIRLCASEWLPREPPWGVGGLQGSGSVPSFAVSEGTHCSLPRDPPGALDGPPGIRRDSFTGEDGHGSVDLVLCAK